MSMTKRTAVRQSYVVIAISAWALNAGFGVAYGSQSRQKSSDPWTAQGYAQAAVHAGTVTKAHADLQRTLNCLVGTSGNGYDKTVHDRCSTDGILAEFPRSTKTHIEAQKAAQIVEVGLSASDLGMVHKTAGAVLGLLHGKGVKGEYD